MSIEVKEVDREAIEMLLHHSELVDEVITRSLFEAGIRGKKLLLDRLTRSGKTGAFAKDPLGVIFQRSRPGQSPSLESGDLRKSVDYVVRQPHEVEMGAGDGTEKFEYAEWLEEGTEHMEKRPYIKPTLDKVHTEFMNDLVKYTEEMLDL